MEIDLPRQRIGLSMRLDDEPGQSRSRGAEGANEPRRGGGSRPAAAPSKPAPAPANNAFAEALLRAKQR
jgi:uncharacterized protein